MCQTRRYNYYLCLAAISKLSAAQMTELVREASNWAFRLDLQESESISLPHLVYVPWPPSCLLPIRIMTFGCVVVLCAGIEQVRAQELGMLEEG